MSKEITKILEINNKKIQKLKKLYEDGNIFLKENSEAINRIIAINEEINEKKDQITKEDVKLFKEGNVDLDLLIKKAEQIYH